MLFLYMLVVLHAHADFLSFQQDSYKWQWEYIFTHWNTEAFA